MRTQPELTLIEGQQLMLEFPEGDVFLLSHELVRRGCTCAACRQRRVPGELLLPRDSVASITKILRIEVVGGYAARFAFSDRHRGGLYSWPLLRELAAHREPEIGRD